MTVQAKVVKAYANKVITLADGTKDRIVKVMRTGYKTEGGITLKAANVQKKGRGLTETGGAVKPRTTKPRAAKQTPKRTTRGNTRGKKAVDVSTMPRREVITALVEAEIFETKSATKGIPIGELRDMLSNGGKKKAPASKRTRTSKSSTQQKKPPQQQQRRRTRTSEKPKQGKKVIEITEEIGDTVIDSVIPTIHSYLTKTTGLDFSVAAVGGSWEHSRLLLQIGLMPTDATEEEARDFARGVDKTTDIDDADLADFEDDMDDMDDFDEDDDMDGMEDEDMEGDEGMEDEGMEDEDMEDEDMEGDEEDFDEDDEGEDESDIASQIVELTGKSESQVDKYLTGWDNNFDVIEDKLGDDVAIGTQLLTSKDEVIIVIGFEEKKQKIIAFNVETEKLHLFSLVQIARMEFVEDDADESDGSDTDDDNMTDDMDFDDEFDNL